MINVINKGDFKSQKEAVWVINNLASGGVDQQIIRTVEMGVVQALSSLLLCKDVRLISIVLETLGNVLNVSTNFIISLICRTTVLKSVLFAGCRSTWMPRWCVHDPRGVRGARQNRGTSDPRQ